MTPTRFRPPARPLLLTRCLPAAALWALAGCGGGGEGDADKGGAAAPPSAVIVDGSSTVYRISKAAQEAYNAANPDVTVVVNNHGTGGGFGRYLQGEVDVVDASRDAKPDEAAKAKAQGIEWTRFLVGYDGITVVVNPKNDFCKSLTVAQLKALWAPDSKVHTWKDLDPTWPDRKIVLYSPDHDSGTFEFFVEAVIGKTPAKPAPAAAEGSAKGKPAAALSQREDVQASSDDNTLVSGVAGDADGLGYFGYAYYASNTTRLRAVPVQNGPDARPVMPDPETVLNKTYAPLSRPLYIFCKNNAMKRPEVARFVRYYLLNIRGLAENARYVPPTAADLEANAKALAGGAADTPSAH